MTGRGLKVARHVVEKETDRTKERERERAEGSDLPQIARCSSSIEHWAIVELASIVKMALASRGVGFISVCPVARYPVCLVLSSILRVASTASPPSTGGGSVHRLAVRGRRGGRLCVFNAEPLVAPCAGLECIVGDLAPRMSSVR